MTPAPDIPPSPRLPAADAPAGDSEPENGAASPRHQPQRKFRQLPFKTRVLLTTSGIVLLILGIAGLFLPFLQGILFLVLAAAVLSLASQRVYGWLHSGLSMRWPAFWTKIERFRTRVLWKFRR